jgi:hypothetical protein
MSNLMHTDDNGNDHEISDVLMHCFDPSVPGDLLYTLCGQNYENVMYANWPVSFMLYASPNHAYEVCQECVVHPGLPLALLGDV